MAKQHCKQRDSGLIVSDDMIVTPQVRERGDVSANRYNTPMFVRPGVPLIKNGQWQFDNCCCKSDVPCIYSSTGYASQEFKIVISGMYNQSTPCPAGSQSCDAINGTLILTSIGYSDHYGVPYGCCFAYTYSESTKFCTANRLFGNNHAVLSCNATKIFFGLFDCIFTWQTTITSAMDLTKLNNFELPLYSNNTYGDNFYENCKSDGTSVYVTSL